MFEKLLQKYFSPNIGRLIRRVLEASRDALALFLCFIVIQMAFKTYAVAQGADSYANTYFTIMSSDSKDSITHNRFRDCVEKKVFKDLGITCLLVEDSKGHEHLIGFYFKKEKSDQYLNSLSMLLSENSAAFKAVNIWFYNGTLTREALKSLDSKTPFPSDYRLAKKIAFPVDTKNGYKVNYIFEENEALLYFMQNAVGTKPDADWGRETKQKFVDWKNEQGSDAVTLIEASDLIEVSPGFFNEELFALTAQAPPNAVNDSERFSQDNEGQAELTFDSANNQEVEETTESSSDENIDLNVAAQEEPYADEPENTYSSLVEETYENEIENLKVFLDEKQLQLERSENEASRLNDVLNNPLDQQFTFTGVLNGETKEIFRKHLSFDNCSLLFDTSKSLNENFKKINVGFCLEYDDGDFEFDSGRSIELSGSLMGGLKVEIPLRQSFSKQIIEVRVFADDENLDTMSCSIKLFIVQPDNSSAELTAFGEENGLFLVQSKSIDEALTWRGAKVSVYADPAEDGCVVNYVDPIEILQKGPKLPTEKDLPFAVINRDGVLELRNFGLLPNSKKLIVTLHRKVGEISSENDYDTDYAFSTSLIKKESANLQKIWFNGFVNALPDQNFTLVDEVSVLDHRGNKYETIYKKKINDGASIDKKEILEKIGTYPVSGSSLDLKRIFRRLKGNTKIISFGVNGTKEQSVCNYEKSWMDLENGKTSVLKIDILAVPIGNSFLTSYKDQANAIAPPEKLSIFKCNSRGQSGNITSYFVIPSVTDKIEIVSEVLREQVLNDWLSE